MGALHAGHMALVVVARTRAPCVVMSIFVNPLQFGPAEDFGAYPRPLDADVATARACGVDILFLPAADAMYPPGRAVSISVGGLDSRWEGAARPGHFSGVLTVVAKLFHLVAPDVAVFGQKDIQQVTLIRALVRDLDFPIALVVAPTVREPDGLALSSRNAYLNSEERGAAVAVPRALRAMHAAWRERGVTDVGMLEAIGRDVLSRASGVAVDYVGMAEPERLEPVSAVTTGSVALVAVRVGRTRLIDNIVFDPETRIP
jgi:pantoate--beta-alanine ligase